MYYKEKIPVGSLSVTVGVSCPSEAQEFGLECWSLRPRDALSQYALVAALQSAFREMGVHKVYAPNVASASTQVVDTEVLSEQIQLGAHVVLHQNPIVAAKGIFLGRGYAFAMSTVNCGCVIATAGEQMIVANARHVDIVGAVAEAFLARGVISREIAMYFLFVSRDLARSLEDRACRVGIGGVLAMNSLDEFPDLVRAHHDEGPAKRNLFIVKRNQHMPPPTTYGGIVVVH